MAMQGVMQDKLIALCARIDIAAFVLAYIKYLRKQGVKVPAMRIINMQSLENLPRYLKKLEMLDGFANVEKIIIFADAGVKRRETEHFIFKVKRSTFLHSFNHDVFLFPKKSAAGNWTPGFMEDLLVPVLKQDTSGACEFYNLRNIAHEFIFCVDNCRGKENHLVNYNKNFLYSYFAGTEEFVGLRLGEAATKGAFNLDDESFKDLREFLSRLEMRA